MRGKNPNACVNRKAGGKKGRAGNPPAMMSKIAGSIARPDCRVMLQLFRRAILLTPDRFRHFVTPSCMLPVIDLSFQGGERLENKHH
jgi:hypothetical protein